MTDPTIPDPSAAPPVVPAVPSVTPAIPPPRLYTVNRAQDGAQVRAELDIEQATSECAILNGQSRTQVGLTAPVHDKRGVMVKGATPVFGSMYHGEVCRYEVRSADGLVIG